jgi:hypothetical protein
MQHGYDGAVLVPSADKSKGNTKRMGDIWRPGFIRPPVVSFGRDFACAFERAHTLVSFDERKNCR